MSYKYQAIDSAGHTQTDTIEAGSTREAADLLRERGLFVTKIDQADKKVKDTGWLSDRDPQSGVKSKDIYFFTQQMSMLVKSGAQIVEALEAIEAQCPRVAWKKVIRRIRLNVEQGNPLSAALSQYPRLFPSIFSNIISAGEASGDLALAFERLSLLTKQQQEVKSRIIGALTYPAVLLMLCMAVVTLLFTFVLPRFAEMFEQLDVELPFMTAIMIAISEWGLSHLPYVFVFAAFLGVGIYMFLHSPTGREYISWYSIRIPIFGKITRSIILARIFRIWGQLLESKVSLLEAVHLTRECTSNIDFQNVIGELAQAITDGNSVGPVLKETWLVPTTFAAAVVTGEESGKLANSLLFVAGCLEDDNSQIMSSLTRIIEPIMLIVMGLIVGTVAISLFMPMFDMATITGG